MPRRKCFAVRAVKNDIDQTYYTSKNDKKQILYLSLSDAGRIQGFNEPFEVKADGDDVECVKNQLTEQIYQKTDKRPEIEINWRYVEDEYQELYGKAIKLFLDGKKEDKYPDMPFDNTEIMMVYLLWKSSANPALLKEQGFSEDIIKAVDLLERKPDETFLQYVERACNNEYAKDIIKAGIYNALDIASLNIINDDTVKMLNENLEALHYLESIPSEE